MVSGHDAIQAFWAATIKNGLKILSLKTVSIDHNGSNAREIGRVVAEVPGADGKPATKLDGKYVVNWKEVKGVWKLDTDIRNMNK